MADQKTKTTLEVGVDDRNVKRLGETIKRALGGDVVQRFRRSVQELTRDIGSAKPVYTVRPSAAQSQLPQAASAAGGGGAAAGRGGGQQTQQRQPLGFGMTALASGVGSVGANLLQRAGGAAAGTAGGFGAISHIVGAIPGFGQAMAAMMSTADSLTDRAVALKQTMAHGYGQTGIASLAVSREEGKNPNALVNLAAELGIGPQELAGRLQTMGRTSGMKGETLKRLAPEELKFESLTGTAAGTLAGATGTSGGKTTPEEAAKLNREALQSGLAAGIREARIPDYIQQVAGDIEALRSQGILISPTSLFAITRVLGASGGKALQGEAGLHAAKTLSERIGNAGQSGDVFGTIATQVGMQMNPGMSAARVIADMQKNRETYFAPVMKQIVKMGGPKDATVMWMATNAGLSYEQASDIYDGVQNGSISNAAIKKIMSGEGGTPDADKLLAGRGENQGEAVGVAANAAALDASAISSGLQVAPDVFKGRQAEMDIARRTAPMGAAITKGAGDLIEGGFKAYDKGGMGGLMKYGGEQLMQMLSGALGKIEDVFDDINKKIFKSLGFGDGVSLKEAFSFKGMDNAMNQFFDKLIEQFRAFFDRVMTEVFGVKAGPQMRERMRKTAEDLLPKGWVGPPDPGMAAGAAGL